MVRVSHFAALFSSKPCIGVLGVFGVLDHIGELRILRCCTGNGSCQPHRWYVCSDGQRDLFISLGFVHIGRITANLMGEPIMSKGVSASHFRPMQIREALFRVVESN